MKFPFRFFRTVLCVLVLTSLLLFSSCKPKNPSSPLSPEELAKTRLTSNEHKIAHFADGYPDGFWARHDRGNGAPFHCAFSRNHATVAQDKLTLSLTKEGDGFVGAEFRTWEKYSYGYFSVSMKAAKCPGVISSFFIYTGWPWDEIDIEFLGNDTTKVQFNYYHDGVGGHEFVYDLGFDASENFHEYGFLWQEDAIIWYVDGKAVYKATVDIPAADAHIMMNLWNVADSHKEWAGKFDETKLPVYAEYLFVGYEATEQGYKSAKCTVYIQKTFLHRRIYYEQEIF